MLLQNYYNSVQRKAWDARCSIIVLVLDLLKFTVDAWVGIHKTSYANS